MGDVSLLEGQDLSISVLWTACSMQLQWTELITYMCTHRCCKRPCSHA